MGLFNLIAKPEKKLNRANAFRFARRCRIVNPETLSMRDIFDALRFCRIQQEEARKNAVPGRNEMMIKNLARANAKRDHKKVSGIKQIMNSENSKRN